MYIIIYLSFALGLTLWQYPVLSYIGNNLKTSFILRHNLYLITEEDKIAYKGIMKRIDKLLVATEMKNIFKTPMEIVTISFILCVCFFLVGYYISGWKMGLILGLVTGILPIVLLMLMLNSHRIGSSKEGDLMIQELLSNYKVNNFNLKEAIEMTLLNLDRAPNSKRNLLNLLKGLNKAVTEEEIKYVLDTFKYSIGTGWGYVLASNIYFSEVHGIKITKSLEDLAESVTKSKEIIEYSRREHNESKLMLKYLAPISYLLSIVCACKFFNFSLKKFFLYQFGTTLGIQWFIIMIIVYIIGICVSLWLSNEKMDI